ncbi:MAG: M28 family peptidase, partial [Bryobacteraceae bacterium]
MNPKRFLAAAAVATAALAATLATAAFAAAGAFDPQRLLDHVKHLSSESMRGRATGSPELDKAADYIAKQFKKVGLQPIDGKSYYQTFSVTTNARLGGGNQFEFTDGDRKTPLKFEQDFIPFNFSSRAKVSGNLVFAGYGITAREYNYDDYAGLDAKGKLVVVLRHEPQEFDEKSVFAGKVYTEHAQFPSKVINAKNHGAIGVILISDRPAHKSDPETLEAFGRTAGPGDAGLPFVQVRSEFAQRWLTAAGKSLEEIHAAIDRDLAPQSFALPASLTVSANVALERDVKTVRNVAGYLPGHSPEHIVIGAHYDHLGLGDQFSMAPSLAGTTHPGADDNASGTAGVIELAHYFASRPKPKRGILFLAFAGEELGLLGSSHYVNHPSLPLDRVVAMIN